MYVPYEKSALQRASLALSHSCTDLPLLPLLLLLQTSTYQPKTTPSFPRKDEMSATWWLMVIKRIQICVLIDICTQDAWIERSNSRSVLICCPFLVCVCVFADVAVASPLLRDTGAKYMENTFIATTIYFDCLTHRQTGRTNNKKLSHFPCSNVNGLLPLGTQHSQCERFYIVFNQQTDALYCDCYCYCCCCSLAPQPLFIRICVTVCAQHIT